MDDDLPPGFRFYPTEEELVSFYLHNKLEGRREDLNRAMNRIIPVLDIYEFNPWDLPQYAGDRCNRDPEQWFFFIPRQESEARGGRPRRLTTTGYWKATGSPGPVYSNNRNIGIKRTMVFYKGRAPNGRKTEWKMNEYKAINLGEPSSSNSAPPQLRHEFSLCRVYKKSKSLRAFDRRPLGLNKGAASSSSSHFSYNEATRTTPFHQSPPLMAERGASSPESSSSGDHAAGGNTTTTTPSQTVGDEHRTSNPPTSTDETNFWDWGQFDWNFNGQDHF